jgi:hypothetical protein
MRPLGCLLHTLPLGLQDHIQPKRQIYYCNTVWPQYKLDDQSQWPENGTFDLHILLGLDNFFHRNSKLSEIPFVQAFLSLCSRTSLLQSCNTVKILLASNKPPSQSLCLSLRLNSCTCDLTGSVCPPPNSSCRSSTLTSSPTPTSHDSEPPFSTSAGSPKHLPPYPLLQQSQLTLSHQLLRNQHCQPCSQPLLHPHPSPPHLCPIPTPIPCPKHAQPTRTTLGGGRS